MRLPLSNFSSSALIFVALSVVSCGKGGNGTNPSSEPALTQIKQLSTGLNYACGVDLDSNVQCIGQNYAGQFGDGTVNDASSKASKQKIKSASSQ